MKKTFLLLNMLFLASFVFAQNFRAGLQFGTNMESTEGYAFTLGAHADSAILPSKGLFAGAQMDFSVDSVTWSSNPSVYLEWILPYRLFNTMSPFVKGNLGMFVLHEKADDLLLMSGLLASVSAGLNFEFNDTFYIEPALSFGYPFMWSFSVGAGWHFGTSKNAAKNKVTEESVTE